MSKKFERLFFIAVPLIAFVILAVLIIYQRVGVSEYKERETQIGFLPEEAVMSEISDSGDECLFIYSSEEDAVLYENLTFTLCEMCVDFTEYDISGETPFPELINHETLVVALGNGELLVPHIDTVIDWVKEGGNILFAGLPGYSVTSLYPDELGLQVSEWTFIEQRFANFENGFYTGSEGRTFDLGAGGVSLLGGNFLLLPAAEVYMTSSGDQGSTPMVWSVTTGEGRVTVINYDVLRNQSARGIFAQSYAHTVPVAVWPVINASSFFIDDFPAQVPEGTNEFLDRDYGVTIDYFYTNIWWPDIQQIGEKYGLKYTGIFVESYDDDTQAPFERPAELAKQRYFGQLLLEAGNEMGTRGHNHQPLVLRGFGFRANEGYKHWESAEDIVVGFEASQNLMSEIYGGIIPSVYAPPANIWDEQTRSLLVENFPNIKVFSGLYYDTIYDNSQDFEVADDGLINFPRIASNCIVSDYDMMFILSELNLHYVNSHFMHPDDALDESRSAKQGWEAMRDSYESLAALVTGTGIRQLTASESAAAVQRFDALDVEFTSTDTAITANIGGFYDEAYLFVRLNESFPGSVTGGELTHLDGSLYLLRADSAQVEITLQ
ncbi:MAG: DUF2194 domain-containing protein [Ruminococcus sp.]|jgi:hypothetical protein|nr:DUF2194 domain-containing protein [Ruminococcus sp.]